MSWSVIFCIQCIHFIGNVIQCSASLVALHSTLYSVNWSEFQTSIILTLASLFSIPTIARKSESEALPSLSWSIIFCIQCFHFIGNVIQFSATLVALLHSTVYSVNWSEFQTSIASRLASFFQSSPSLESQKVRPVRLCHAPSSFVFNVSIAKILSVHRRLSIDLGTTAFSCFPF